MRVILKSTKLTTGTPNLRGIFLATAFISNYMLSFICPMIVTGNSGNRRINPQKVRPKSQLSVFRLRIRCKLSSSLLLLDLVFSNLSFPNLGLRERWGYRTLLTLAITGPKYPPQTPLKASFRQECKNLRQYHTIINFHIRLNAMATENGENVHLSRFSQHLKVFYKDHIKITKKAFRTYFVEETLDEILNLSGE